MKPPEIILAIPAAFVGLCVAFALLVLFLTRCASTPPVIARGGDCAAALEGCIAAAKAMELEADASPKEAWGWYESCANRAGACHLDAAGAP